jgi:hypothetical protein
MSGKQTIGNIALSYTHQQTTKGYNSLRKRITVMTSKTQHKIMKQHKNKCN